MRNFTVSLVLSASLLQISSQACAEKWVEFHHESWSHHSKKLNKKLRFSNNSYYDSDSLTRTAGGDVSVVIRDVSHNDRFYVGKGVPEKEVVYKRVLLKCTSRKYEVVVEDGADPETAETIGEEIKAGSVYDALFKKVCVGVR